MTMVSEIAALRKHLLFPLFSSRKLRTLTSAYESIAVNCFVHHCTSSALWIISFNFLF